MYSFPESVDMSLSRLQELVMDQEVWSASVHEVTKSQTWPSDWTEHIYKWKGGEEIKIPQPNIVVVVFQLLNHVQLFVTSWTETQQAFLSFTISWSLLKLMSMESMMPSNHLIFCCPLLLLPSIFPSIRVFPNESALHIRWTKYWSFSISLSNEYSGSWNKPWSGKRLLGEPGSWSLEKQGPEVLIQTYLFNQDSSTIF